jgi:hypothetical protein
MRTPAEQLQSIEDAAVAKLASLSNLTDDVDVSLDVIATLEACRKLTPCESRIKTALIQLMIYRFGASLFGPKKVVAHV